LQAQIKKAQAYKRQCLALQEEKTHLQKQLEETNKKEKDNFEQVKIYRTIILVPEIYRIGLQEYEKIQRTTEAEIIL
jgi:hypothetical protein